MVVEIGGVEVDLGAVADYCSASSADLRGVDDALTAEAAAQAMACRTSTYSHDLLEALKRRVACNLARRNLPLGVQMSEAGGIPVSRLDSEIRRLEGPYRKLPVG
ncbi:hypothetical protein [Nocardioides marmoraquaticus]